MNALTGKVALVTGSSRGIGAAIARLFAQHGAMRNEERIPEAQKPPSPAGR